MVRIASAAFLLVGLAGPANAGLITLTATSAAPDIFSNFVVTYDDTGDGLLQFGEVTSFSGMVLLSSKGFTGLLHVPTIAGVSTFSGPPNPPVPDVCVLAFPTNWCFGGAPSSGPTGFATELWTYTTSSATNVPEPGTFSLLGAGAVAWMLMRRRKSLD